MSGWIGIDAGNCEGPGDRKQGLGILLATKTQLEPGGNRSVGRKTADKFTAGI